MRRQAPRESDRGSAAACYDETVAKVLRRYIRTGGRKRLMRTRKVLLVSLVAATGLAPVVYSAPARGDEKLPAIAAVAETIDLGDIKEGAKPEAVFVLENRGQADLVVERTRTGCGCTIVSKLTDQQKIIPPGESQELRVSLHSKGRPGPFSKPIYVTSNDPTRPELVLTLKANVLTILQILPNPNLHIKNVRRGEVVAQKLKILPNFDNRQLEIVSFDLPGSALTYTAEPIEANAGRRGFRMRFQVGENAPLGPLAKRAQLVVRVGEETETKEVNVTGTVLGDFKVTPTVLQGKLGQPYVRGLQLRPIRLSSVTRKPFEVFEALAGPNFETSVEPNSDRTLYTIRVRIAEQAVDGPCAAFLEVRTDSVIEPVVHIPVYVNVAPRVGVEPSIVLLKPSRSGQEVSRRVVLQTADLADFTILGIEADSPFVQASSEADQEAPHSEHVLMVRADGRNLRKGKHQASVTVRTDVAGAEEIRIPVTVLVAGR